MSECQTRFSDYEYDRPILRGEGGVWSAVGCCGQHPDINALYYHKALWAQIGGPFCWGEWYPRLFPDELGLQGMFAAFEQFMSGERPYKYHDIQIETGNLRTWGMMTEYRLLLWVDNRLHTWKRVADDEPIPPVSGTISVPCLVGDWWVHWWDTTSGNRTRMEVVHADGVLELVIDDLEGDVAVKAAPAGQSFQYLPLVCKR
jgi:hypothetical protein